MDHTVQGSVVSKFVSSLAPTRLTITLFVVWIVILLVTPFAPRELFAVVTTAGVVAQTALVLAALRPRQAHWRIARHVTVILLVSLIIEVLGVHTGFPFGEYQYTGTLQPQIMGVPLLIPLAWVMMLFPAWGVTEVILGGRRNREVFAVLGGIVFAAWDLFLDPQMTYHGLWTWTQEGAYSGIPWTNFAGWWFAGAVITWIVNPRDLPGTRMTFVYSVVWVMEVAAMTVFWDMPDVAIAGSIGMGSFSMIAWTRGLLRCKS